MIAVGRLMILIGFFGVMFSILFNEIARHPQIYSLLAYASLAILLVGIFITSYLMLKKSDA